MKAIFGQVIAIAVLSLVLVGVYFYKTTRQAFAADPSWGSAPVAQIEVSGQPKQPAGPEKIEVVGQRGVPTPPVHGQVGVQVKHQKHHGFLYRLFHPSQWRIFHRHGQTHSRVVVASYRTTVCEPVMVSEVVYQPVMVCQPAVVCTGRVLCCEP